MLSYSLAGLRSVIALCPFLLGEKYYNNATNATRSISI